MTALQDARAHLRKAQEFLDAATINLESKLFNAATSNAVSCGINAKDAICLKLTRRSEKSETHSDAAAELKRAGGAAAVLTPTLSRLLRMKSRSQYQAASVARGDATRALGWARRIYDGATEIVVA